MIELIWSIPLCIIWIALSLMFVKIYIKIEQKLNIKVK